jgi:hypothetical protein
MQQPLPQLAYGDEFIAPKRTRISNKQPYIDDENKWDDILDKKEVWETDDDNDDWIKADDIAFEQWDPRYDDDFNVDDYYDNDEFSYNDNEFSYDNDAPTDEFSNPIIYDDRSQFNLDEEKTFIQDSSGDTIEILGQDNQFKRPEPTNSIKEKIMPWIRQSDDEREDEEEREKEEWKSIEERLADEYGQEGLFNDPGCNDMSIEDMIAYDNSTIDGAFGKVPVVPYYKNLGCY